MKSPPKVIERILGEIRRHRTFCVVGHVRPDGDCVGSQLGLTLALLAAGKTVSCWNQDPVPPKLRFLDPRGLVARPESDRDFDCVISTDAASLDRLGSVQEHIRRRKTLINIDHHPSNTCYGDLNWIDAGSPSTGELIYRLIEAAHWPVTPEVSDCLFTAVSTDTGSFQYPTTRPSTYQVAGELVHRGANLAKICDEVYQSHPLSRVRLLRHLYNKFRLTDNNRIAYLWLKKADFARAGADPSEAEGLIDHIRDIEPVVVACVLEEVEPELTRISLRSKSEKVDVNEIAGEFQGGGHRAAAGARIPGRPLTVQRRVVAAIRHALARVNV